MMEAANLLSSNCNVIDSIAPQKFRWSVRLRHSNIEVKKGVIARVTRSLT